MENETDSNSVYQIPLEDEPEMAALLGVIIGLHTRLEEQMRELLCHVTGMDAQYSRIIFYALSARARREILIECIRTRFHKDDALEWERLIGKKIKRASEKRNQLAHHHYCGVGKSGQLSLTDFRFKAGATSQSITKTSLVSLRKELAALNRELMEKIHLLEFGAPFPQGPR